MLTTLWSVIGKQEKSTQTITEPANPLNVVNDYNSVGEKEMDDQRFWARTLSLSTSPRKTRLKLQKIYINGGLLPPVAFCEELLVLVLEMVMSSSSSPLSCNYLLIFVFAVIVVIRLLSFADCGKLSKLSCIQFLFPSVYALSKFVFV